jgi:hypothetical protein
MIKSQVQQLHRLDFWAFIRESSSWVQAMISESVHGNWSRENSRESNICAGFSDSNEDLTQNYDSE